MVDHKRQIVTYKNNEYPFSDFKYKTTGGQIDFGIRVINIPEIVGKTYTDGRIVGVATGKVEHILANCGDDFWRVECQSVNKVLWLTTTNPMR